MSEDNKNRLDEQLFLMGLLENSLVLPDKMPASISKYMSDMKRDAENVSLLSKAAMREFSKISERIKQLEGRFNSNPESVAEEVMVLITVVMSALENINRAQDMSGRLIDNLDKLNAGQFWPRR